MDGWMGREKRLDTFWSLVLSLCNCEWMDGWMDFRTLKWVSLAMNLLLPNHSSGSINDLDSDVDQDGG
jgi:hypothetical protein